MSNTESTNYATATKYEGAMPTTVRGKRAPSENSATALVTGMAIGEKRQLIVPTVNVNSKKSYLYAAARKAGFGLTIGTEAIENTDTTRIVFEKGEKRSPRKAKAEAETVAEVA